MTGSKQIRTLRARGHLVAFVVAACLGGITAPHGAAAILIVSNTSASGPGSLQQAILDANATNGLDTIIFNIPGAGVHTITPANALPPITDSVVIDATTQPGFDRTPLVELDGSMAGDNDGLRLQAGSSTIRGLAINRFTVSAIHVLAPSGTNSILGNFIGTAPSGSVARGNGLEGVWLSGSTGNLIGGTGTNGNVIAANGDAGVYLLNSGNNTIQGNFIGINPAGTVALGNANNGIYLINSPGNLVGGTTPGARNVVSGNGGSGLYLHGSATTGNLVQGNYVGTDATGTLVIPNAGDGVTAQGAGGNMIGGTNAGAGNLLSGNSQGGVGLKGTGADNNQVQGNFIGTDASGGRDLGNALSGITIFGGNSNMVGGTISAARNIISANKLAGVYFTTNSVGNLVQGNYIGLDVTGVLALGNSSNGISIDSASLNTVGGTTAGARNVISGNTGYGVEIFGTAATGNLVQGNYVGADVTGQSALRNKLSGMHIQSSANTIGGLVSGAGNLVSGNGQIGIFLDSANAANNVVQGNFVGTDATGTNAMPNWFAGLGISGAPGNTIGGVVAGAGNVISGNGNPNSEAGVFLIGPGASGNVFQGNRIGTDPAGRVALGNTHEGIYATNSGPNTIGGSVPGAGNIISANGSRGIFLDPGWGTVIQGDLIGVDVTGTNALGNGTIILAAAVELENGSHDNMVGGPAPGAGNRIAYAPFLRSGVRVRNGATNNAILGNAIFSNAELGIDLGYGVEGTYGVTPNVPCNTSGGANMAQNYPVLTQAVSGNSTGIRGTFNSRPNRTYSLQFFANPTCNSHGCGEGQIYLGQESVVTSNDCSTSFVAALPGAVPVGYVIAATATDSANNTSEFSACFPVAPTPALAVSPAADHQVALTWTNTATGFVLKETSTLSPPVQWTTVTNSSVLTNGQFVVTLPAVAGSRFYLLSFE